MSRAYVPVSPSAKQADPEAIPTVSQEEEEEEFVRGFRVHKTVLAVALSLGLVLAVAFMHGANPQVAQVGTMDDRLELDADGHQVLDNNEKDVKEFIEFKGKLSKVADRRREARRRARTGDDSSEVPELNMRDQDERTRQLIAIVNQKSPEEAKDMVHTAIKLAARRAVEMHQKKGERNPAATRKLPVVSKSIPRVTDASRQVATAACVFDALSAANYIARVVLMMQQTIVTCPNAIGLRKNLCRLDGVLVFVFMGYLAQTLSEAASDCAQTANFKALCADSVISLIVALTQVAASGMIMKETCMPLKQFMAQNMANGGGIDLGDGGSAHDTGGPSSLLAPPPPPSAPLGQDAGRRLFIGGGKANMVAQCILDVTDVTWSMGQVGLAIFSAKDSCPLSKIPAPKLIGSLTTSMCTVDVSFILYLFAKIATFLDVSVIHCSSGLNLQAFCAAGVTSVIASAAVLPAVGAGLYAACNKGVPMLDLIDELFPGPSIKQGKPHSEAFWTGKGKAKNARRRLEEVLGEKNNEPHSVVAEKIWRAQGHNVSYAEARTLMGLPPMPQNENDHVAVWRDLGYNINDPDAPEWKAPIPQSKLNDDLLNVMSPFLDLVGGTEEEKAEFKDRWPTTSKLTAEL